MANALVLASQPLKLGANKTNLFVNADLLIIVIIIRVIIYSLLRRSDHRTSSPIRQIIHLCDYDYNANESNSLFCWETD